MVIARTQKEFLEARGGKRQIGFVPTMGALHEGHLSLMQKAVKENECSVISVFVNPTQFGPKEDLSKYPRTFEQDAQMAEKAGVNIFYYPSVEEIYPSGWSTFIEVENITNILCGAFRPGHFRGVATVVYRFFDLIKPTQAYFGQKDLQQCLVIQRMIRDLGLPVQMQICPTVRESDGLAMSSRNRYLTVEERKKAIIIYKALCAVRDQAVENFDRKSLLLLAQRILNEEPSFQTQYVEILSMPDLSVDIVPGNSSALFIAGHLGTTRLIDNMILG